MKRTCSMVMAVVLHLVMAGAASAQERPLGSSQFRAYAASGKTTSLDEITVAMANAEVVFIGEIHNDPMAHSVELQLLQKAHARYGAASGKSADRKVTLALEMFERDVQLVLDEYLAGSITERHFLAGSRPWNNYAADYRPLVEYARAHALTVVAANAPERYVNRVARLGRDSLQTLLPTARAWLAPLPYGTASPAYANKFRQAMGEGLQGVAAHGNPFLLDAQALRDATMAHSIAAQFQDGQRPLVLHVNGNFHSQGGLGTPEQLRALRRQARSIVVTIIPAAMAPPIEAERLRELGDFVIIT
ncbi:MAG: ChaN family lipoprotein [Pyrinomonadaceae bacterium]